MIISASRRTDIPACHSDWLINCIKEKSVCVKNPMNNQQVRKVNLAPEEVDCIVFWTKNPKPMLEKIQYLSDYAFYFQFTLNPYDNDIETGLPSKKELIETFQKLSEMIGSQRVIWRYDPILLNTKYTVDYHYEKFAEAACQLKNYTEKVIISFIDFYKKISANIKLHGITDIPSEEKSILAERFSKIARENNLIIETCAEDIDLSRYNIGHAKCIDDGLISKITRKNLSYKKDKNQRFECGCVSSVDIGEYNTCSNGCIYCYANNN